MAQQIKKKILSNKVCRTRTFLIFDQIEGEIYLRTKIDKVEKTVLS